MRAQLDMLVTRGAAKELVGKVVTHPGTSHSGRSLTSIPNHLAIKSVAAPYQRQCFTIICYLLNLSTLIFQLK